MNYKDNELHYDGELIKPFTCMRQVMDAYQDEPTLMPREAKLLAWVFSLWEDFRALDNDCCDLSRVCSNTEFGKDQAISLLNKIGGFTIPHPEYPKDYDNCKKINDTRIEEIKDAMHSRNLRRENRS